MSSQILINLLYFQESENECRSLCFVVEAAWWGKAGALSLLISQTYYKVHDEYNSLLLVVRLKIMCFSCVRLPKLQMK